MPCPYLAGSEEANAPPADQHREDPNAYNPPAGEGIGAGAGGDAPRPAGLPADAPMHYRTYLHLNTLLGLQNRVTGEGPEAAHDEHLFIVVHQVFELGFKQILFELNSVKTLLPVQDQLSICCRRLARIVMLLKNVLAQFPILESMTALDFREFRDHLFPASGFQSHQFRLIENTLGVRPGDRVPYNKDNYRLVFKGHDDVLRSFDRTEEEASLFDVIELWLEQIFQGEGQGQEFWRDYCGAVDILVENKATKEDKESARKVFNTVTMASEHKGCLERGERRLSHTALQGALLVFMRRDLPRHSEQFTVLQLLQDIDALMGQWRFLHMATVQRMIGTSTAGTSGSVGFHYLRATLTTRLQVFLDISNLSSFLLPRPLLQEARARMAQDPSEERLNEGGQQDPEQQQVEGHQQAEGHQQPEANVADQATNQAGWRQRTEG